MSSVIGFEQFVAGAIASGERHPGAIILAASRQFDLNYGAFVYVALKTDSVDWLVPAWRDHLQSDLFD